MNVVFLVFLAPMLVAGVVTLPVMYMNGLGGWQGIAVGFLAAWLCAMMLATIGYIRYAGDIKGIMGRLIYDRQTRRRSRD